MLSLNKAYKVGSECVYITDFKSIGDTNKKTSLMSLRKPPSMSLRPKALKRARSKLGRER